jgi:hypothetical protein
LLNKKTGPAEQAINNNQFNSIFAILKKLQPFLVSPIIAAIFGE